MIPHETARALAGVKHGFFGREGGVSSGIYASLNAGTGSNDDPANVLENRRRSFWRRSRSPDRCSSGPLAHRGVH